MVVLPPLVEVNTIDVGGKATREHNYEYQLEQIVTEVLVEKLHSKGYAVKPVTKKEIHDLKISRKILAFQEEYQQEINKLYTPLAWEEKKAFVIDTSLKSAVKDLGDSTHSDVIVFVEYAARNKTSGATAKDTLIGLFVPGGGGNSIEDASQFVSIRVALIDATNYNILWSNITREGYSAFMSAFDNMSSIDKADRRRLNQLCDVLLAKLPKR